MADMPEERREQSLVVQHGGTKLKGKAADPVEELVCDVPGTCNLSGRGLRRQVRQGLQRDSEGSEHLPDLVVKLAPNGALFVLSDSDQLSGQLRQAVALQA